MTDVPFDPTVFTHNRDRLMEHEVAALFLQGTVALAHERKVMSDDHFSVDGSLIEAWASMKSFRPKGDDDGDNNGFADFKGTKRSNDTHESKTDPYAKLFRKGRGKEAKLSFMAHVLMENRNGLVVDALVTEANGTCERDAAHIMLDRRVPRATMSVGADKAYDTGDFVDARRAEEIGLYHRVVSADRVGDEARELAERLARGPSFALEITKDALNREAGMDLETAFEHEGQIQAACMLSPNFREAYEAFVAKREPNFR